MSSVPRRWRLLVKTVLWLCALGVAIPCCAVESLYRYGVHEAGALPEPRREPTLLLVHRALWAAEFGGPMRMEPQWSWTLVSRFVGMFVPFKDRDVTSRPAGEALSWAAARALLVEQRERGQLPRGKGAWHFYGMALSMWFSRHFTAEQALDWYADRADFGCGASGIESAARTYFGKSAETLTLHEAAMLVGVLQSPRRASLERDPDGAWRRARRTYVLRRMREHGLITDLQEREASLMPIEVRFPFCSTPRP